MTRLSSFSVRTMMLLLLAAPAALAAEDLPHMMASLGDSITAATLSSSSARPASGDTRIIDNKDTLSWASGSRLDSHHLLLQKHLQEAGIPGKLVVLNESVRGERAEGMEAQAAKIVEAAASGKYSSVKYVTVLFGANDACSSRAPGGTPDDQMRDALSRGFAKLAEIRQEERIRVLVSALPRIPDLGFKHIREARGLGGLSCARIRKLFGYCESLLDWTTDEEHQDRLSIVKRKNDVLRQAVADAQVLHPNLDIHFSERFFEEEISVEYLAGDCFHPNAKGQQKLSTGLWEDQPWFRD